MSEDNKKACEHICRDYFFKGSMFIHTGTLLRNTYARTTFYGRQGGARMGGVE